MASLTPVKAALAAALMFTVLLLGYEIAAHVLLGPDYLDTHAIPNMLRFIAAAIGSLGGAAAVLWPRRATRRRFSTGQISAS